MAQYSDQHGRRTDEYGDLIRQTEEHGDPVHRPAGVDYGTTGAGGTYGTQTGSHQTDPYGTTGTQQLGPQVTSPHVTSATIGAIRAEPYAATGTHPTGGKGATAGSTGAYQTDPDKATGTTGAYETDPYGTTGTAAAPQGEHGGHHEKKGMVEKIEEKLPGHHHKKTT